MARRTRLDPWLEPRLPQLQNLLKAWAETAYGDDLQAPAELVSEYLLQHRFDDIQTVGGGDLAAAVVANRRRSGSGAATVLVVGFHDGPWLDGMGEVTVDDRGIVGPGVASRFAPFMAHIEAYTGLTEEADGMPPVNIVALSLDSASVGTGQIPQLLDRMDVEDVDVILATPAIAWDYRAPTITLGARGELLVELVVSTGRDLGVNAFAGAARNSMGALIGILGQIRDDRGRITVPGFYNRAVPPTTAEREALSRDGHDPAAWTRGTGASLLAGGPSPLERASAWPTVEVVAINSGIKPRVRSQTLPGAASATVNFALVAEQRAAEVSAALRSWLETRVPEGVDASINVIASAEPYLVARNSPWVVSQARALKRVFGRSPVPVLGGGHPGIGEIASAIGRPMLFSGIGAPASFVGTADERITWQRLQLGVNVGAEILEQLNKRATRLKNEA